MTSKSLILIGVMVILTSSVIAAEQDKTILKIYPVSKNEVKRLIYRNDSHMLMNLESSKKFIEILTFFKDKGYLEENYLDEAKGVFQKIQKQLNEKRISPEIAELLKKLYYRTALKRMEGYSRYLESPMSSASYDTDIPDFCTPPKLEDCVLPEAKEIEKIKTWVLKMLKEEWLPKNIEKNTLLTDKLCFIHYNLNGYSFYIKILFPGRHDVLFGIKPVSEDSVFIEYYILDTNERIIEEDIWLVVRQDVWKDIIWPPSFFKDTLYDEHEVKKKEDWFILGQFEENRMFRIQKDLIDVITISIHPNGFIKENAYHLRGIHAWGEIRINSSEK